MLQYIDLGSYSTIFIFVGNIKIYTECLIKAIIDVMKKDF